MTPDEKLSALISDRLIDAGLIDAGRRDEAAAKIAAGTARPEDWQLWIELGPSDLGQGHADEAGDGDAQD